MIGAAIDQDPGAVAILVGGASALATVCVFAAKELIDRRRRRKAALRALVLFSDIVCRSLEHEQQIPVPFEMKTAVELGAEILDKKDVARVLELLDTYRLRVAASGAMDFRLDETERQRLKSELESAVAALRLASWHTSDRLMSLRKLAQSRPDG